MPATKRFLLMLVLACITCLVLIQISMEDKGSGRAGLQYSDAPTHVDADHSSNTTPTQPRDDQAKTPSRPFPKPTSTSRSKRPTARPHTPANSTGRVEVQVRRVPLAQNLVNRQERVQELLKQGGSLQGRRSSPLSALKSIPLADPGRVTRVVVLTYFRAGSSFFGDILQQNWRTFYHFEPLHSMTYDRRVGEDKIPQVFALLDAIFACDFPADYVRWVRRPRNQFLFAHNLFLWATCRSSPKLCFDPAFVRSVCRRAPVHVVKVTRLHMRHLERYLAARPQLDIRVVHLTRDPRAVVSSRWSLEWCNGTDCSDPAVLCGEMERDADVFERLRARRPSRFAHVRYEDLAAGPERESEELFRFLGLPFTAPVKKFLETHTVARKSDDNNPYSTRRNSSSMVSSWRERFTFEQVRDVQAKCADVLRELNHSAIDSPEQLPHPFGRPSSSSPAPPAWRFHKNPLAQKYLAHRPEYFGGSARELIPNNTNIEVHKTYRVADRTLAKKHSVESPAVNNTVR